MNSENIILGQILQDNNLLYKTDIKEGDFINPENKRIYLAIKSLSDSSIIADLLTVHNHDKNIDVSYLAGLTSGVSSTANFEYHVDKVKELSTLQHLETSMLKGLDMVKAGKYESNEILEEHDKDIVNITTRKSKEIIKGMNEVVPEVIDELERRFHSEDKLQGIPTGFSKLDELIGGLQAETMTLICARPSDGKTSLMLNMASHIALRENKSVGILSLESPRQSLMDRIISCETMIDKSRIMNGLFTKQEFEKISAMASKLYDSKLFIYDVPNLSIQEVKSQARRMRGFHKIDVLFIDYAGIIQGGKGQKKFERIEQISMELKELTRLLKIPTVILTQINREATKQGRPRKEHLSDSDQLVKDADNIILLHHERDEHNEITESCMIVDKSREAKQGFLPVKFIGKYTMFREL